MSVARFLLTAPQESLEQVLLESAFLNPIERRGDVLFVTAFLDLHHTDDLIACCQKHGVTLQRRDERASKPPYWRLLHQGTLPAENI